MGKTCNSKVVGYCMGNKNDFGSKGLSDLHWVPLYLIIGLELSSKGTLRKAHLTYFFGMQELWYTQQVGLWFPCGFDAIALYIKMAYYHLASPHGVPEIWETKNWSL